MPLQVKYFVLKPRSKYCGDPHAKASRAAMLAYAESIASYDGALGMALADWASAEDKADFLAPVKEVKE